MAEEGTDVELHRVGVRIATNYLRRCGVIPASVTGDVRYDPQVVGQRGDHRLHFAVRTAWLPELGQLECEQLRDELVQWAQQDHAHCYLIRVGLDRDMRRRPDGLPHHHIEIEPLDHAPPWQP